MVPLPSKRMISTSGRACTTRRALPVTRKDINEYYNKVYLTSSVVSPVCQGGSHIVVRSRCRALSDSPFLEGGRLYRLSVFLVELRMLVLSVTQLLGVLYVLHELGRETELARKVLGL